MRKQKSGILYQLYVLAVLGLIVVGICTFLSQQKIAEEGVTDQLEQFMRGVSVEATSSITEYPAYSWLLRYWYEHGDELDIEYDVDFGRGTETEEKCRIFSERHPDLQLRYMDEDDVRALPGKDQKLYAEIVYSWMTTRFNQIKRNYGISFLFCLVTDTEGDRPYQTQYFLISGADEGAVRGTEYEQVYPLGKVSDISENQSQQEAMRQAVKNAAGSDPKGYLANAGAYLDYYSCVESFDGHAVLIGVTDDFSLIMKKVHDQTVQGTSFAVMYQILLIALIMLLIFLTVLRPLRTVVENIRLYTKTKDRDKVIDGLAKNKRGLTSFLTAHNEIGSLSDDVGKLANEMEDYLNEIETITAEKERIGVELDLASRIQTDMLPNTYPAFPNRTEFDIYGSMTPAREVGGDFYDYFLIDDDHLAMVIADVSGKGIPAALFMMISKIIMRNKAVSVHDPAKVLEEVNNEICQNNNEEMFVTVWLGILDLSGGLLTASNAGHEYPCLKAPDGRFELIKDQHGFVIGGMEDMQYTNYEILMKKGSKIFVYTDGLAEASNEKQEMFGTDRMIEALRKCEDERPEDILKAMDAAVKEFVGEAEQFDDLTMLCLEYTG